MVFKILKGDKNQIAEKSQRSAEEHTHKNQQNNQQESNLWLLCGWRKISWERETEKKDEQQMRKVEKIEDDDEFSV